MKELNETKQIDLSYLETTFGNNRPVIIKVLDSFLKNTPPLIDSLLENIKIMNWEEVRMIAHKIKTSFNTVGAKLITDKLNKIERDALEGDKSVLMSLAAEIKTLSKKVFNEVNQEIDQ